MIKVKLLLLLVVFIGLSGCTDNGFLLRSIGAYDATETPEGFYYIGKPYQIKGVEYTPQEDYDYREKGMSTWYLRSDANRLTTNGEIFDSNEMTASHKTLPLPSLVRVTNLENGNVAIVRVNDRGPNVNNRLMDVSQKVATALEFPATGTTLIEVEILPEESRRLKEEALQKGYAEGLTETISAKQVSDIEQPVYEPESAVVPVYETDSKGQQVVEEEPLELMPETPTESVDKKEIFSEEDRFVEAPTPAQSYVVQLGAFGNAQNVERATKAAEKVGNAIQSSRPNVTVVQAGPFKSEAEAREALDKLRQSGYADAMIKIQK